MQCKICQFEAPQFARAIVLNRYEVDYFQCSDCGFVQTESPYWLDAAYSDAIAQSDVGLVLRNNLSAVISSNIIFNLFNHNARFLDYGGGYGLFVRLMRDLGYDFYWTDRYCQNLFAQGFAADLEQPIAYELVTAFEVLEHLVDPIETIEKMLTLTRNLLFSTTLLPSDNPQPHEWGYYALHEGQHVSIYTLLALQRLADRFRLNLYTNGTTVHLLTERTIDPDLFKQLTQAQRADQRKASLLEPDYFQVVNALLQERQGTIASSPLGVIAFPDWQQPEDSLLSNLVAAIRQVLCHPQCDQIVCYLYLGNPTALLPETAELFLSTAIMQVMMEDEIDIPDGLEILLLPTIDPHLQPQPQYRLPLLQEDKPTIATLPLHHLPPFNP